MKLQIQNIKRVKAIEIIPEGNMVVLSGRNGAGKTTCGDSLFYALGGKWTMPRTAEEKAALVTKGEKMGRILAELGDGTSVSLVAKRTINAETGNSEIYLTNENGAAYPKAQETLEQLIGELSFDPVKFSRMTAEQQFDELRNVVHLDIDIEAIDDQDDEEYRERREVNNEAKNLVAQVREITVPEGTPTKPIDVKTMVDQQGRAANHNSEIDREEMRRKSEAEALATRATNLKAKRARIKQMLAEVAALEKEADAEDGKLGGDLKEHKALPALPERVDTVKLSLEIAEALEINKAVARLHQREELAHKHAQRVARLAEIDLNKETHQKTIREALQRAKMPLPGLGWVQVEREARADGKKQKRQGYVTYQGRPLSLASQAEQLRVSVAIAMAANPKLRVLRIKDGNQLDPDGLKLVAEMAESEDYQIWMEYVDTSGEMGVVIEDGAVVKVNKPKRARKNVEG